MGSASITSRVFSIFAPARSGRRLPLEQRIQEPPAFVDPPLRFLDGALAGDTGAPHAGRRPERLELRRPPGAPGPDHVRRGPALVAALLVDRVIRQDFGAVPHDADQSLGPVARREVLTQRLAFSLVRG